MLKPHLVINREDGPYLHRWHLIPKNKWFNIYLHHFLGDDVREACHSHPWYSIGLILKGSYKEITPMGEEVFKVGKIKLRGPNYYHRVELITSTVWTLFITGPVIKDWFFLCPKGPVSHKEVILKRTKNLHEGISCPD